jgi:hypothetical protein
MIKDQAIRLIQSLPDDCTLEEIQYCLFVQQQVEHGLAVDDHGRATSPDEAEAILAQWLEPCDVL